MTIAYIDLIDSFKHFDKIMSQMLNLESEIKSGANVSDKLDFKTHK